MIPQQAFEIFVVDPNNPGKLKTLRPDPKTLRYRYDGSDRHEWSYYFVDTMYQPKTPPCCRTGGRRPSAT